MAGLLFLPPSCILICASISPILFDFYPDCYNFFIFIANSFRLCFSLVFILGTGCNAAFVEHISEIDKWTGDDKDPQHVSKSVNDKLGVRAQFFFLCNLNNKNNSFHQLFSVESMYMFESTRKVTFIKFLSYQDKSSA